MNSPGFIFKKQNKKQCSTLSEIVDLQKFGKVLVDFLLLCQPNSCSYQFLIFGHLYKGKLLTLFNHSQSIQREW